MKSGTGSCRYSVYTVPSSCDLTNLLKNAFDQLWLWVSEMWILRVYVYFLYFLLTASTWLCLMLRVSCGQNWKPDFYLWFTEWLAFRPVIMWPPARDRWASELRINQHLKRTLWGLVCLFCSFSSFSRSFITAHTAYASTNGRFRRCPSLMNLINLKWTAVSIAKRTACLLCTLSHR